MEALYRTLRKREYRAQAIVEFAIALPVLLMMLLGILEVGRLIFIYAAVNNASREAVRYASAIGLTDDGQYTKYTYCAGIKDMARRSAFFVPLTITITYDHGPDPANPTVEPAPFHTCTGNVDTTFSINTGTDFDRVKVTVTTVYTPLIKLLPLRPRTITTMSARTITGYVNLDP